MSIKESYCYALTNPLFVDNLCSLIFDHFGLSEYCESVPRLSHYHHLFLAKNRHLLFKLIKRDWNHIFIAYPKIKLYIQNICDSKINAIIHQLTTDFLSLVNNTNPTSFDESTTDEYIAFTIQHVLKCCSHKMWEFWLQNICKLKKLTKDNLRIVPITMLTESENEALRYEHMYSRIRYFENKHTKRWKIVHQETDMDALLEKKKPKHGELQVSRWRSYDLDKYAIIYLTHELAKISSSSPIFCCIENFLFDLIHQYVINHHKLEFDISNRAFVELFDISIKNNDYKLWRDVLLLMAPRCKHTEEDEPHEYNWCDHVLQEMAERIVQIEEPDVMEQFICALKTDTDLISGLDALKQHFTEYPFLVITMCLYGGTVACSKYKPLDPVREIFGDSIGDLEFEIVYQSPHDYIE